MTRAPLPPDKYRSAALATTTMGILAATVNSSIVIISLPAIFRGLGLDPLTPGNVGYLLWLLMGYLLVTAVLVVTFGRLGDVYGRARLFNLGFLIFTLASVGCALVPNSGSAGVLELIFLRVVQGVGGAMLTANSTAILTDAFPPTHRGLALGINQVAAIAGSFLGLVIGGLLAQWNWRAVFWISVPFGLYGTVAGYRRLHDTKRPATASRIDWLGNVTFAAGLIAVLTGITYGIQPYRGHSMGWTSPLVLSCLIGGFVSLVAFVAVAARRPDPMLDLRLFRIRAFAAGNAAGLLAAISRGGLQFMLIIWLQGIWLPLHGYDYADTPLWAGIYLLPLTIGFLLAGPASGWLSDRFGARAFATGGLLLTAVSFAGMIALPTNFDYRVFAILLALNGIGSGMFAAPNTTAIMNSVPARERGAASGVRATFLNTGTVLSIGVFFSLMIAGLASRLPVALTAGLTANGVPAAAAARIAAEPPGGSPVAAFLGVNPVKQLAGPTVLHSLPPTDAARLTDRTFFPHLLADPFRHGLAIVFVAAIGMILVATLASLLRGGRYVHDDGTPARPDSDGVEGESAPTASRATAAGAAHRAAPREVPAEI